MGTGSLNSAIGETAIVVTPEKETVKSGEIVYVDVFIMGENGVVESNADRKLTVNVTGGKLLAFGSANPRTEERFDFGSYTTYYGRALAVVQVEDSEVTVTVTDGIKTAATSIAAG